MKTQITGTELLAPARDLTCGTIAVDAGADAVYIGAPRFGARARAGNDLDEIAALVDHAHTYWARVYVTVNTLLHDDELPEAVDLIHHLHATGVDAVIIQDTGLLESDLPDIPLIASTQMHNATPAKVRFLQDVGFRRAILARELTLDEIRAVRAAAPEIDLEVFVHGALCVSYSGQCTMSYAVGGRSGNRGECAQPCRRSYDLVDSWDRLLVADRHLLSLRDMNRMADLGALLDAGVTSFKIEGRLKDEVYVANVVSAYRRALDTALAQRGMGRSSSGTSRAPFTSDVAKTFNRDFTPYFLHGRDAPPGAIDTPKMVGEPIGDVTAVNAGSEFARTFTVRTDAELNNGDGLTLFDAEGRLRGASVNQAHRVPGGVELTLNSPVPVEKGTRLYRNHDHTFIQEVRKRPPERTIAVCFALAETADGFTLTVEDEDGVTATVALHEEKDVARKPEQATATAHEQLAKTGGTPFYCEDVTVAWSTPYFLPFSTLNDLRRRALDALLAARAAARPALSGTPEVNDVPYPETTLTFRGNVLNAKAAAFYRRHGVTEIEPAAESGLDMRGRVVMTTRYCIKEQLGWCPRQSGGERAGHGTGERAGHDTGERAAALPDEIHEPLYLIDEDGHRYQLRFHCDQAPSGCGMEIRY